jgi:hypothetical protein
MTDQQRAGEKSPAFLLRKAANQGCFFQEKITMKILAIAVAASLLALPAKADNACMLTSYRMVDAILKPDVVSAQMKATMLQSMEQGLTLSGGKTKCEWINGLSDADFLALLKVI